MRLNSSCTGSTENIQVQVNYGLNGGLDMTSSCVRFEMGLAQVPLSNLMAEQSYSYTYILYRDDACVTFLERSEVMMFTPLQGL